MPSPYDLKNNVTVSSGFDPQALSSTTDIVGNIIDMQGFDSLTFVLQTDAIAASNLAAVLLIEEDDASNLASASAVADADLLGTEADTAITQATASASLSIGYTGSKRYVRPTLTVTTNDGTDVVSCLAIKGSQQQI